MKKPMKKATTGWDALAKKYQYNDKTGMQPDVPKKELARIGLWDETVEDIVMDSSDSIHEILQQFDEFGCTLSEVAGYFKQHGLESPKLNYFGF